MKKLFAIFLVLAMLIPMCLSVQAEEAAKKPFSLVNWEDVGIDDYDSFEYVYYTPYFWANPDYVVKGELRISAPSIGGSGIKGMAEALKELFDTYPEGARYINFSPLASCMKRLSDICYSEAVPPLISAWVDEFMAEYKAIGGKLDGVIIDVEYLNIYAYYINSNYFKTDPLVYDKIVKNPAYAEKIRPELEARGFKFYSPVTPNTPEIYGIQPNVATGEYAACDDIWDTVMRNYQCDIITESMAPMWKYFPDAVLNDYSAYDAKPWINGGAGGIKESAGNAGNEVFYSTSPDPSFFKDGNKFKYPAIKTRVDGVFDNNAYNRFLYEANYAKNISAAADDMMTWWIAHAYYGEAKNPYVHTPYYCELLYHLGLMDPEIFFGYIMRQDCKTGAEQDSEKFANALKIVDQCLGQLTKVAGYADRTAIKTGAQWNHAYVLSGMTAGGKNIWRLTPDNNVISLEDFRVADAKDPTFKVNGETVTFPGGKIIEDDEIFDVGTYGFWIETPANVTPVITRVDNYFRVANPTYQETFESYEAGTEWDFNNAKPATAWENKKQGSGTAVVIADPANADNKLVEIKGGYNFKLVKLPKNVRSGDNYAKHQAWEVTVTLPSDVTDDDELILLNIIPEKKTGKDKGFKVVGTKVYYDQNGEYVELSGVTLTAGGKYTFIRELDYTTADAFTCDYYVYDAAGAVVGKAKDIPIADKDIPVYSLGMNVKNPSGAGVLLDDYRIYPTKTTADFTTFNAVTGMAATGSETGNVAYRLSWLNTAQREKSHTVMAAYYDGETLLSEEAVVEVKMPANGDGVFTGVVENKQAGKVLKLYLKDNNPAEDEDVVTDGGAKPEIAHPEGTTAEDATVTVTKDGVVLWQGPGQGSTQCGTANSGEQLKISATITVDGTVWGKDEDRGWLVLGDTNYDEVIKQRDSDKNPPMIIIIAAAVAVVVIAVVVVVIVVSKKKKKPAAPKPEKTIEE